MFLKHSDDSLRKPFEKKDIKQTRIFSYLLRIYFYYIITLINALCINSGQSVVTMYYMLLWRIVALDNVSIFILFIVITLRSTSR